MNDYRILVVDDEEDLCEILKFNLEMEGYQVDTANSAEEALKLDLPSYNLLLLDVMMGEISGFKMASMMKKNKDTAGIPIIFITAKDTENDTITGFNLGADDYISKPFRIKELLARMKSVLRRCKIDNPDGCVRIKNLEIRTGEAKVFKDGKEIILTAMEYRLLLILLNNRGHILSRTALLENIWDVAGDFVNDNTLTVYIKRLRDKIEDEPENPSIIRTVRGMGYVIEND